MPRADSGGGESDLSGGDLYTMARSMRLGFKTLSPHSLDNFEDEEPRGGGGGPMRRERHGGADLPPASGTGVEDDSGA
jgi:hypothetical protein